MRRFLALIVLVAAALVAIPVLRAAGDPPPWAYAIPAPTPPGAPAAPDTSIKQIPGSALSFTRQQIADGFGPADWFPGDHPAMPDIVAHGKRPDARACGLCHYPNGKGRQENAGVSGLPVSYFIQQMNDFRSGVRKSADPRKANTNIMIAIAKAMTPDEIRITAEYFGAMKWTPWVRVVETDTVPKMVSRGGIWIPLEGNQTEPIGVRIMETPESPERTEILRDPRSGFIAYAPVGSISKGEVLVKTGGNGRTVECGMCHGADLQGLGPVPGIAGRSPSYVVRQMYDMQTGARHGEWADLMKPVVMKLTDEDFVNIAAYVSSRMPPLVAPTADVKAEKPAATTWTAPRTPDGQPDLQGVWLNNSATPLERPKALEGRSSLTDEEVNELRKRADRLFKNTNADFAAGDAVYLAALADIDTFKSATATGTTSEMIEREFDNRTSLIVDPPNGRIPSLTAEAQQKKAAADAIRRRPPEGPEDLTQIERCLTYGVPRLSGTNTGAGPLGYFEIVQTPSHLVLFVEAVHEARIIHLDGRPHLPTSIGEWAGDSRGRWEGNTLVVDTTNFSARSDFRGSSDHLHLVERFTRAAPDRIDYEITIDDPTTWTRPWTAVIRLKQSHATLYEYACHEGNIEIVHDLLAAARAAEAAATEAAKRPK